MFSRQAGFIPVIPDVAPPYLFEENDRKLSWKGWDAFLEMGKDAAFVS
jgi:hypothetical protein